MKTQRMLIVLSVALAGVFAPVRATTPASFESTLQEADKIRSSKPDRFVALLKQMDAEKSRATPQQVQKLKYLQAYETAMYRDRLDQGVEQAKALFKDTKDVELKYRAGSLIVNLTAVTRDFSVGLRYLERTLPLRDKIRDKSVRHDGIGAAAMFYNEIGQYAMGLRYANEMLSDAPSERIRCAGGHVQVESNYQLGKLDGGRTPIDNYIALCASISEFVPANLLRATLARKLAAEGDVAGAVDMLQKSLPEVKATRYPRLIAETRSILAELKLAQGDLDAAKQHADATIALGESIRSTQARVSAYRTLYRIAEARGQPVEALGLYKLYADADRERINDVKARELAYEIVRQETQQKNQRIGELEREKKMLQLQQNLERESAQKARLAMVFLMLVLAGIVYWAVQVKRHQAQLRRLAQTDTLTGIGNRHYFTQKSERALLECARAGEQAALVMFDLDHFKAINDTYGHGAGDWVLKQVGKTCLAHCRKIDYIGRIGGEEFAILLRGLDLAGAARLAEDCRAQLTGIDTRDSGYTFVVTASFGVTSTALSGYDLSRLLSHADQMLYRAKKEGRNRVCAYSAEVAADARSSRRAAPALSVVNTNG